MQYIEVMLKRSLFFTLAFTTDDEGRTWRAVFEALGLRAAAPPTATDLEALSQVERQLIDVERRLNWLDQHRTFAASTDAQT
jgi:hypothetical protein